MFNSLNVYNMQISQLFGIFFDFFKPELRSGTGLLPSMSDSDYCWKNYQHILQSGDLRASLFSALLLLGKG